MLPLYESDAVRVDGRAPPVFLFEYYSPNAVTDDEVQMILRIGDQRLEEGSAYVPVIIPPAGGGLLRPRHRKMFSDWLFDRASDLQRSNLTSIVVVPDRMVRALLRIIYRFRAPTMRTLTAHDLATAADLVRKELERMGEVPTERVEACLSALAARNDDWKASAGQRSDDNEKTWPP